MLTAVLLTASLLTIGYVVTALACWAEDEPPEMTWTDEALGRVLAALDETAETWDWADEAIALGNDDSHDRTLAEIRALPTKETA